jgi:DNA end-binding protein Ku
MRAFWSGSIEWGMLAIPVKLYTASKDSAPKFHRLHKACNQRITVVNRCDKCEVDVPWEDIVSGHEVAEGEYVAFTKEELGEIKESDKSVIQILHTTAVEGMTPNLFNTTYWIGSGAKRAKAYGLLRDVLEKSGAVAIGSVTLRTRPRLCMIGAQAGLLTLTTLHYHEEMVDGRELVPPALETSSKEQELAITLVRDQMQDFDSEAHTDDYARKLAEAVAEKVDGGEVVPVDGQDKKKSAGGGAVVDLEELLKRSVAGAAGKGKAVKDAKAKAKAKKPAKVGKIEDSRRAS